MEIRKVFLVILMLALAASSMLWIQSTTAQSIPKPSVPEFTINIVDHSYDTPPTTPTYTTDPYTGEQKQTTTGAPSYHIENKSIEITIKNQPFTPYTDSNGYYIGLYYNFRYKGHFEADWAYDPFKPDDISSKSYGGWDMTYLIPYNASKSEYTIVPKTFNYFGTNYGQVDFQVQAQIGYIQEMGNSYTARVWGNSYNFTGQSSDWSSIQTITIGSNEVTITQPTISTSQSPVQPIPTATTEPTRNPTQIPIQPNTQTGVLSGVAWKDVALAVACGVIAALAVALVLVRRRKT
jgi:hypothetical protein